MTVAGTAGSDTTGSDGTAAGPVATDSAASGAPATDPTGAGATEPRTRAPIHRAVLTVLGSCVVLGVLQGVIWALTAPGIPYKVLADSRFGALPTTSTYHFVDVAAFTLSGMAMGVVLAVTFWQWRAVRGWQVLVALVGGSLLGALIAWGVGILVAPGTDPESVGATPADSIVIAPPTTGTWLVVLAQPALAAAVYTFLVAWNGHPDLGRPVPSQAARPADVRSGGPADVPSQEGIAS